MDPTGIRTWYVDSRHCTEQDDGSFQLDLWENVEVSEHMAVYIDDLTIVGTMSNVSSNNRLYLYEFTPSNWQFAGTVKSYNPSDLNRYQTTTLTIETRDATDRFPQAYKCDIPDSLPSATVYFDIDDILMEEQRVPCTFRFNAEGLVTKI